MPHPSYIISTKLCTIPHITNPGSISSLDKDLKIYMDDILYKDSAYDKGLGLSIKNFCSVSKSICIAFRNKPKILISKRGHYRLKKERYLELLKTLGPDHHADFDSGKVFIGENELVEPKSVEDFVERLKKGNQLFGTEFVNSLVTDGLMLMLEGNKLSTNGIFDCSCCGNLSKGYLKYLWDIKEMNASTYLAIHNYNVLDEVMKGIEDGKINVEDFGTGSRVIK